MEILIIILLILLNGVFSMSEIALVAAKKFRLEADIRKGSSNAKVALELANDPTRFLSTVQFGITLIGILTGIFSGDAMQVPLEAAIATIPALAPYAASLSLILIVMVVTFFSIVFGELLPKRFGLLFPEAIASVMAKPMRLVSKIAAPFVWLLTATNNLFMKLFNLKDTEGRITEEEIKAIVQQSAEGGEIREIEHAIVDRVFALGDRKADELMTHRSDIKWLDINDSLPAVRKRLNEELHSLYPVGNGSLDNLIGIVNVKEIFAAELNTEAFSLKNFIKKPLVVYEDTPVYNVLEKFRKTRFHHGIVVDEYGSVQGLITLDDVLDALVGNVSEDLDMEYQITQRDDSSWLADAQCPFYELLRLFQVPEEQVDGDYNTIAGYILHRTGRIPVVGEKVKWENYTIEVIDMDGFRIDKVLITMR